MRALVYTAPNQVTLEDRPRPKPASGECEIAVATAGICGSDISGFLGHSRRRVPPLVLGHELVGHRVSDGKRVVANPLISCGRCTACLGGAQNLCVSWRLLGMDKTAGCYQEYVSVPEYQVYDIADELTDSQAVMAEPLANIVHLFRIATPAPFFRMGIVGGGTMGSLALLTAKRLGVREILVLDVSDVRLKRSARWAPTWRPIPARSGREEAKLFAGAGLDLVLDASGVGSARQSAFDLCRPGGLVVLLGMGHERSEIDFVTSIRKEHRVAMSFAYTPVDFERSLALLTAGEIDLRAWTAELPLEQGQEAFDRMTKTPGDTLKMLLRVS